MSTITNIRGEVVDLMTGEVVGRTQAAPTEKGPRSATGPEQEFTSTGDAVAGLVNNTK